LLSFTVEGVVRNENALTHRGYSQKLLVFLLAFLCLSILQ